MGSRWLVAALIASLAAAAWLWRDNHRLRDELAAATAAEPGDGQASASAGAGGDRGAVPAVVDRSAEREGAARRLLGALTRRVSPPKVEEPIDERTPAEKWAERRARRQERIAMMLGSYPGETDDQYLARVIPVVESRLAGPRDVVRDSRRVAEEAAGVTDSQREELDDIFDDAYAEAIDLTNRAIASGELTPYERNAAGVLSYVGGLGAVLQSAEVRVGEVLSPQQIGAMRDAGFDLAEYLGATAPWETLAAPPPPPDG